MEQALSVNVSIENELKGLRVSDETAISLTNAFNPFRESIEPLAKAAYDIVVENAGDIDKMAAAKDLRLQIKSYRINLEKKRVNIKEDVRIKGQAIDGLSRLIKHMAIQAEDHLLQQERYVEILQEKAQAELKAKRLRELEKYEIQQETLDAYQLDKLPNEAYQNILKGHEVGYQERITAEQKAEQEEIERAKQQKIYYDRKDELSQYAHLGAYDKLFPETTEEEYLVILETMKLAKTDYEIEQERIRKENEKLKAQQEADRKKREAVEARLKKERDAVAKANKLRDEKEKAIQAEKARIESEKAQAEKDKALAPDKTKLKNYVLAISSVICADLQSQEARDILATAQPKLDECVNYINQAILNL